MPRWYPEPEKPKVETPLVVSSGEYGDLPADYRKQIMDACGVTKIGGAGFSNSILCPIHKEAHPSAHFHETKGLHCKHEFKWYKWLEVGAALGIEPFKQAKPTVILARHQLAVEAQRELIRLGFTALCRLLDELYLQGMTGGEVLTVKELQAACPNLSAWTVRHAMQQAEGKSKGKQKKREFLREIFPSNAVKKEQKKTLKNSRRHDIKTGNPKGRPSRVFRVPALTEVYTALDVQPETWQTDLPSHSRRNAAQYRAEVTAAKIRRKAGKYAIKQLTVPLGISAPTLRAYCKRANIEVTPTLDKSAILTADDIQALPVNAQELAAWKREGKFYRWQSWLETLDGKHKFTPTQEGAARAGNRPVRYVKRLANHYKASDG